MAHELSEIKVSIDELELGMHVTRLDRPWSETDFLLQGFIIDNKEIMDSLAAQCEFVYIEGRSKPPTKPLIDRRIKKNGLFSRFGKDDQKETNRMSPDPNRKAPDGPPIGSKKIIYINKISTEQEIPAAKKAYKAAKSTVIRIMDGIRIGRMIDVNEARAVVNEIVDGVLRNKDALAWLTKIKNKDEYTAEHSINVSILSATFARHLGHDENDIRQIALGGLLHDVGKSKIPNEILNKEGRFTDEELNLMREHPQFGRNLLMSIPSKDRSAIDIAHSHHERIDGKGYPRQLQEHQIPYYAKVIALVDTYDAITSNRCYDKGRSSMEALDIVYKCKGTQFDEGLAIDFIKCIGVYPPGSIVELNNGEIGIVVATQEHNKLRPRIIVVLDADKRVQKQRVVNLDATILDSKGNRLSIAREHINGSFGVTLENYLEQGLILAKSTSTHLR